MASWSSGRQSYRLRYYWGDLAVGTGKEEDVWAFLEWKANKLQQ